MDRAFARVCCSILGPYRASSDALDNARLELWDSGTLESGTGTLALSEFVVFDTDASLSLSLSLGSATQPLAEYVWSGAVA